MTNGIPTTQHRVFYGWWIVATAALFHAMSGAAFGFTFGQYLLRIEHQFGWSKFAISGAFSASQLTVGVLSPAHGWLLDQFSPRAVCTVGILLFGLGFMLLPLANSFLAFFAVIMVISIGLNLAGWLSLASVITRWFRRKRAFALGLSATGFGFGGVLSMIIAWSIVTHGWHATSFGTGIAVIVIGLPLSYMLSFYPEKHGLLPDGVRLLPQATLVGMPLGTDGSKDFTASEAVRDRTFWYLSLGHGIALISVSAIVVHLVPHLVEDYGWSETSAQAMLMLVTITSLIGQAGGGFISDRFDKARLAGICMLGYALAMLLLSFATGGLTIVLPLVLYGLIWGTHGPLVMAITGDYYGRRHFGQIIGYSNVIVMCGPLIGPTFAGAMDDIFGTYRGAFLLIGIIVGISSMFFFAAHEPSVPHRLRARAEARAC